MARTELATCIFIRVFACILEAISIVLLTGCSLTSMEPAPASSPGPAILLSGQDAESMIAADFAAHDPTYQDRKARFGERLRALAAGLAYIQATGRTLACSTQMYLEADWLYVYTTDWVRLDRQLTRLAESLANVNQDFAQWQSPGSGHWGACYSEWFFQAEATSAMLEARYDEKWGASTPYPVRFPKRIRMPTSLEAYLEQLLVSDIAKTGRDNRGELGSITTTLSSSFFKDYLWEYLRQTGGPRHGREGDQLPSRLLEAYSDFLRRWQDPSTGYWGAWYRSKGRTYKTIDLSITYHMIAYRHGQVAHWPQIIDTTLRIRNDPYPFGWLHNGHLNNHNNYDVARILRYGWSHMSDTQRRLARAAIQEMLAWTLEQSLNPDGSFKSDLTFFSSVAADYYFGVSFLEEIGFWNRAKRFWTEEELADGKAVCRLIKARMASIDLEAPEARAALRKLDTAC